MSLLFVGKNTNNAQRVPSVDIARGLAILLMIESHIGVIFYFGMFSLYSGIPAAPFFVIIAGTAYELFVASRISKGASRDTIIIESVCKAVVLYLITITPSVIRYLISPGQSGQVFDWTFFGVIAVGYIVAVIMPRSLKAKALSILFLFGATAVVERYFADSLSFFLSGTFPVLPWLAYFIFGQMLYELYRQNNPVARNNRFLLTLAASYFIVGLTVFLATGTRLDGGTRDSLPMFILLTGVLLVVLVSLVILVDRVKCRFLPLAPLEQIGRISFSVWYLQGALLGLIKIALGPDGGIQLPSWLNPVLLLAMITAFAALEKAWRKYGYKFGFEWVLRAATRLLTGAIVKLKAGLQSERGLRPETPIIK